MSQDKAQVLAPSAAQTPRLGSATSPVPLSGLVQWQQMLQRPQTMGWALPKPACFLLTPLVLRWDHAGQGFPSSNLKQESFSRNHLTRRDSLLISPLRASKN